MRLIREHRTAVAASALLLALTACGGGDESSDTSASSEETSSEAPGETEEAEEVAPEPGESVDQEQFIDDVTAAFEDITTAHVSVTTDAGAASSTGEGDVDYGTDPPSMAMTMTMDMTGGEEMDIRLVDGIFYLNLGAISKQKFVKLDPSDPNSPLGDMGDLTENIDPSQSFENFAEGLREVEFVGTEDKSGEDLDHYRMTLDTRRIEGMKDAAAQLPKTLTYDVWLDEEDRFRVAEFVMELSGQQTTTTTEMGDFGKDVTIEAPPADQVTEDLFTR